MLEICSTASEKIAESIEETYRSLHVVNLIPRDDKHVVKRSGSKEQRTAFSFFCRCCIVTWNLTIVKYKIHFVCYSSVGHDELNAIYRIRNSGMQGLLTIKISTQNLIRSNQRKNSSRSSPSCRRKAIGTHMMEMVAFCSQEYQYAYQNSKIDMQ